MHISALLLLSIFPCCIAHVPVHGRSASLPPSPRLSAFTAPRAKSGGYGGPTLFTRLLLRGGQMDDAPFGWANGEGCEVEDWKKLAQKESSQNLKGDAVKANERNVQQLAQKASRPTTSPSQAQPTQRQAAEGDSSAQLDDLCADSSDIDASPTNSNEGPDARARARGHEVGASKSSQSKWDTLWGGKAADAGPAPKEWSTMPEEDMICEDSDAAGYMRKKADDDEELVGDRYGMDRENEEGRMWGMRDQHKAGNSYTPGDATGNARAPPCIIDRGSVAPTPLGVQPAKPSLSNKQAAFMSSVGGGLGPREEDVEAPAELSRRPRAVQTSDALEEGI